MTFLNRQNNSEGDRSVVARGYRRGAGVTVQEQHEEVLWGNGSGQHPDCADRGYRDL